MIAYLLAAIVLMIVGMVGCGYAVELLAGLLEQRR